MDQRLKGMEMENRHHDGFAGKFLRLDLTTETATVEPFNAALMQNYLGGRGVGAYFLYQEVDPQIDAFDPANKVIIAPGPLTGTGIPAGTKTTVITKSPLTGGVAYSLASGSFGAWLKFAGYDFVIVEGQAKKPLWIRIENSKITFHPADDLWGTTTMETREQMAQEVSPRASVLCIGPAGENRVRFACVVMDRREAGRGGCGAVLGAKRLKAIVVDPHQKEMAIGDKTRLKKLIKTYAEVIKDDPACQTYRYMGTSRSCRSGNVLGICPTRNFQQTYFDEFEKVTGERLAQEFITGHHTCFRCPIMCEKICEVKEGEYAGAVAEGLEYETMFAYGSECGNSSLESIIKAGMLSDHLGLDSLSTGLTIGFAMECFEAGLLSEKDTDGLRLDFGNHRTIIELIKKIAYREGIGDLLAEGSRKASLVIGKGAEAYSMTVKGLEMAGWDPRGAIGQALGYGTSNRGACHTTAAVFSLEIASLTGQYGDLLPDPNRTYDQFSIDGKAELVKFVQDNRAAMSALGACYFARPLGLADYAEMFAAVTGTSMSPKDLLQLGERIYNLERIFNLRSGLTTDDDWLPKRFYEEPSPVGPTKGHKIEAQAYQKMLEEYYALRGWDSKGVPALDKIEALNLEFTIPDSERRSEQ
jgi:aldehyde:ferredoxin oxidoreductase